MDGPQISGGERDGVWAGNKIPAGQVIERAPVVVVPPHQAWILGRTDLAAYLEPWTDAGHAALPLGFAPLYREGEQPNAEFVPKPDELVIEIVATRDIEPEDEVVVARLGLRRTSVDVKM